MNVILTWILCSWGRRNEYNRSMNLCCEFICSILCAYAALQNKGFFFWSKLSLAMYYIISMENVFFFPYPFKLHQIEHIIWGRRNSIYSHCEQKVRKMDFFLIWANYHRNEGLDYTKFKIFFYKQLWQKLWLSLDKKKVSISLIRADKQSALMNQQQSALDTEQLLNRWGENKG